MNFWWRWLVWWLVLGFGLRCFMLAVYPQGALQVGLGEFLLGVLNDLQAYFMVAGIVAIVGLLSQRWLRIAAYIAMAATLVVFTAEVFFWLEFESRLDRLVFHYLAYPKEVLVFLEDQFFLSFFAIPLLLISWGLMRLLRWPQHFNGSRLVHAGLALTGVSVLAFGQPVGQSVSRVGSEFVSNGYLGVLSDARFAEDDIEWLADALTAKPPTTPVALPTSDLAAVMRRQAQSKRHVVLIIEESFAGPVWEDPQLRQRFLPNFSALADASVSFTNLYATGSRTTRGLEAILNGFPPLPGVSTTQRQHPQRLPSLARGMQEGGFYPVFLYGGWPGFSGFFDYWRAMGFQRLWSREDFADAFETSWGVADGALLQRIIVEMNQLSRHRESVFLATLTVSHHRPFDFPDGAVPFPALARRSDYAMAYADHALGKFFEAARKTDWYEDTLFVVVADHGLLPRGDALIPANSYHIPMVLHGHGITPRQIDHLGSSVSIPRTLMSLLDIDTAERFGGEDLLCDCDTVVPVEAGYHIGLLERGGLHVLTQEGEYVAWDFDITTGRLSYAQDKSQGPYPGGFDGARRRVLNAFAPAYRWFYQLPAPRGDLAGMHHADVAGE